MVTADDRAEKPRPAAEPPNEVILCVDDEPTVLSVLTEQLEDAFGDRCDIASATSGKEALEVVKSLDPDRDTLAVVIADQIMPGMTGTELLAEISRLQPQSFKVLLTGQAGLDAVVYAINTFGLNQYIAKPWNEHDLRLAVESLLARFRLVRQNAQLVHDLTQKNTELERLAASLEELVMQRTRELEEANAQLAKLAVTDGLTGLFNHRYFQERVNREVERTSRTGDPVTLLMIDVDHFKHYNDTHGHQAGDRVLRRLASILSTGRRVNDVVARYGGEEFALILSGTDRRSGAMVAEYLRRRVENTGFEGEACQPTGRLTISIGVGSCPEDGLEPAALIYAADEALYQAKADGRNRVVVARGKSRAAGDEGQATGGGGQATGGGGQATDGGSRATGGGGQTTSGGGQTTSGGGQTTDGGGQATGGGGQATDGGCRATDGGGQATDGGSRATNGGGQATDGGGRATDGGGQTTSGEEEPDPPPA